MNFDPFKGAYNVLNLPTERRFSFYLISFYIIWLVFDKKKITIKNLRMSLLGLTFRFFFFFFPLFFYFYYCLFILTFL